MALMTTQELSCKRNSGRGNTHGDQCRIMESLRLEKTSKIIKSNRHPITTMPTKPCPDMYTDNK